MDKFEETVVNPNISLKNFDVKVRDSDEVIKQSPENSSTFVAANKTKKDSNLGKSIILFLLLTAIIAYQVIFGF